MRYTFFSVLVLCSIELSAIDLGDLEVVRAPNHHYEVSDIFGVAKLIRSLVKNADQLKALLQHPADVLKATLLVGGIAAMVKVSLLAVQGLGARMPEATMKAFRLFMSWCMRMLHMPEGFDVEQLAMSEQMFEQIMVVWCDRGGRALSHQATIYTAHWDYQRHFVQDMLGYLIGFFESHQKYYRAMQLKRGGLVMTTHVGDNRIDHVCFLVQSVLRALQHLVVVIEQASSQADFDVEHVKKVVRTCIILMRKLYLIIDGGSVQTYNQSEYGFSGQLFNTTSTLFDV